LHQQQQQLRDLFSPQGEEEKEEEEEPETETDTETETATDRRETHPRT
jgi:hypothetical protein